MLEKNQVHVILKLALCVPFDIWNPEVLNIKDSDLFTVF